MRSEQEVSIAIETYSDMVLRLCGVYLKNDADAEDIFQTVFLRYALRDRGFDSPQHEKAWLIRVTVNACKDLLKSFFRSKTVPLTELPSYLSHLDPQRLEVLEAVWALPGPYREVMYLHYYEGYTAPEIARILKKNPNTIYTPLTRAKAQLKEALGGEILG